MRGVSLGPPGSAAGGWAEGTELSGLAASTRDQAVASVARCCRLKASTSSSSSAGGTGGSARATHCHSRRRPTVAQPQPLERPAPRPGHREGASGPAAPGRGEAPAAGADGMRPKLTAVPGGRLSGHEGRQHRGPDAPVHSRAGPSHRRPTRRSWAQHGGSRGWFTASRSYPPLFRRVHASVHPAASLRETPGAAAGWWAVMGGRTPVPPFPVRRVARPGQGLLGDRSGHWPRQGTASCLRLFLEAPHSSSTAPRAQSCSQHSPAACPGPRQCWAVPSRPFLPEHLGRGHWQAPTLGQAAVGTANHIRKKAQRCI